MKPWQEMDLYEFLGVSPRASTVEIRKAVANARRDVAPDSIALYSVLDEGEDRRLAARLEEAARVLGDPTAREAYDLQLGLLPVEGAEERAMQAAPTESAGATIVLDDDTVVTGEILRRARQAKDLSLRQLSLLTKIGSTMIEAVEAGDLDRLPEPVYLRGFVMTYAREVHIDPDRAWRDYKSAIGL